jgi:hypothetical protein
VHSEGNLRDEVPRTGWQGGIVNAPREYLKKKCPNAEVDLAPFIEESKKKIVEMMKQEEFFESMKVVVDSKMDIVANRIVVKTLSERILKENQFCSEIKKDIG